MSTREDQGAATTVVVGSRVGLHARPAAIVARAVGSLDATVRLSKDGAAPVDASSPLFIMTLGAKQGDEVLVQAEGPGAADAVQRIAALIAQDLDADDH